MGRRTVKLLNLVARLRRKRCRPEELFMLIPSCLQNSECTQRITYDIMQCRRCGRCKVKDMVEMAESYGVRCAVATGGRLALEMARAESVKAVVAVACEKELTEGMRALLPKVSVGVINMRPNGPCKDTDVDLAEVEEALRRFLGFDRAADSGRIQSVKSE